MGPGTQALSFLLNTVIDLYVMVIALRFVMQAVRADYYNPLAQFVVKASNPPLIPLRRVIPGIGGQDIAALMLCLILLIAKMFLFKALGLSLNAASYTLNPASIAAPLLVYLAAVDLLALFFNIFFFAIIIQAVISWINPGSYNPVSGLLDSITGPLLRPIRGFVKPVGGLDLSPLVALILLQVVKILVIGALIGVL
ncbi:MAG: YggT family protein [Pseudomonadota bacterium]